MEMNLRTIIVSLILAATNPAIAGKESHGGDAVKTKSGQMELLDYVEPSDFAYTDPSLYEPMKFILESMRQQVFGEGALRKTPGDDRFHSHGFRQYPLAIRNYAVPFFISTANCKKKGCLVSDYVDYFGGVSAYVRILLLGRTNGMSPEFEDFNMVSLLQFWIPDADWAVKPPKQLIFAFTNTPLEEIHDEGAIRNIDPDLKVQVAAQKDGVVLIHKPTFDKMPADHQVGLFFHEGFVGLLLNVNPSYLVQYGTEPIRKYNRLLKDLFDRKYVPQSVLEQTFMNLQVPDLIVRKPK